MPDCDAIQESLAASLTQPVQVSSDEGSVRMHSLTEQIALAKHLCATSAASSSRLPIRFAKTTSPGAGGWT